METIKGKQDPSTCLCGYKAVKDSKEFMLGVTYVNGKKRPCLVYVEGNTEVKLASFDNSYCARKFIDTLADMVGSARFSADELPMGLLTDKELEG